jgi:hypothetical protein
LAVLSTKWCKRQFQKHGVVHQVRKVNEVPVNRVRLFVIGWRIINKSLVYRNFVVALDELGTPATFGLPRCSYDALCSQSPAARLQAKRDAYGGV